ncbi:gamma-tubulin complex component 3-like [Mercenaria mercenaria]|uniref:gamma-tubulin complex component 3-like n=1 Tax=Mercenaria mercenaria TaxID=6596 RepID=UPI00234FB04E|nr:gamma-tubulin complex component 3-like [Mercenaria mercenaria]
MSSRPSSRGSGDSGTAQLLLRKLCCKITGLSENDVQPYLQRAYTVLGSNYSTPAESDEFQVSERIRRRLVRRGREKDAITFAELHRKLQSQGLVKNRWAILYLLMSLSESESKYSKDKASSSLFSRGLPSYATSTPFNAAARRPLSTPSDHGKSISQMSNNTTASSGISSIHSGARSNDPTPVPQSFLPSTTFEAVDGDRSRRHGPMSRLVGAISRNDPASDTALVPRSGRGHSAGVIKVQGENTSFEIPESELVKDLVYVFQGIEGKWIKFDVSKDAYKVDAQAGIPKAIRQLVSKLAECGWLFNKVKNYVETRSADKTFGLVGQSFCAALQQELTEYYRLVAVLESQLQEELDQGIGMSNAGVTLRRLVVWTFDPLIRLKSLAAMVDVCKGKKGGALASAIYSYMQHGDPFVKSLIKHILTMVSQPIYATLLRWIYDGELEDTHDEFFVAADPTVKNDKLWHDKYSLRKSMIPTFITTEQAKRILLTGKSINYLRQVCQDRSPTKGREAAMALDMSQAEWMFTQDLSNNFLDMIDTVYKETSRHLLDVLHAKYKFMDHLKAMRRYLLLGQGDFIRHLMDLLEEDLAKPASNLYLHNLTGILETAIRGTNAQFDDSDILKRLDVRLLEVSPGDTGWDVFSLDYHVDGPIRTVFTPECMIMYLRVFNFLWRAKRMEYVLSLIWKNQIFNAKLLQTIPELSKILHQCHMLGSEMVHFIQQTQYYISFEVLECSWHELLSKVREAEDLDCVIAAHETFLDTIITRCLLDEQSRSETGEYITYQGILTQLRTIFDLIIDFQQAQDSFYQMAQQELMARQHFIKMQKQRTNQSSVILQ